MANIGKLMKQAKQMQDRMGKLQEELAQMEKTFTAGGGAIEVTARGDQSITGSRIKPEAVDPDDVEGLEDLLMTAVNGALEEVKAAAETEMKGITGGMNIPGLM